jgi:hypothetical protein
LDVEHLQIFKSFGCDKLYLIFLLHFLATQRIMARLLIMSVLLSATPTGLRVSISGCRNRSVPLHATTLTTVRGLALQAK